MFENAWEKTKGAAKTAADKTSQVYATAVDEHKTGRMAYEREQERHARRSLLDIIKKRPYTLDELYLLKDFQTNSDYRAVHYYYLATRRGFPLTLERKGRIDGLLRLRAWAFSQLIDKLKRENQTTASVDAVRLLFYSADGQFTDITGVSFPLRAA